MLELKDLSPTANGVAEGLTGGRAGHEGFGTGLLVVRRPGH